MKILRSALLLVVVSLYLIIFFVEEKKGGIEEFVLQPVRPAGFYITVGGYVKQLIAEILFTKTSVFIGGLPPGVPGYKYEKELGYNFDIMTTLYPRFIDPYFLCQGTLPHISQDSARVNSEVLKKGIEAHPDNQSLHFFYASNYFLALDEPLKAARAFDVAANLPGASPMFAHLSALLSAKGGDILAGLISLRLLLADEKEEVVRKRYLEEIIIFEQAVAVQDALNRFEASKGFQAEGLRQLVPDFLSRIPTIHTSFVLVYKNYKLSLQRPARVRRKDGIPWR